MNPAKLFVVAMSIAAGYLFAQIPAPESNGAPKVVAPTPTAPAYASDDDRSLSGEEILRLYFTHRAAIEARPPGPDESMRTMVETWLATNAKHDPRSPKYVPTPMPELPPPMAVSAPPRAAEEPRYTQPAPVAAAPAVTQAPARQVLYAHRVPVTVRYGAFGRFSRTEYRVQYSTSPYQQQYYRGGNCANGRCR